MGSRWGTNRTLITCRTHKTMACCPPSLHLPLSLLHPSLSAQPAADDCVCRDTTSDPTLDCLFCNYLHYSASLFVYQRTNCIQLTIIRVQTSLLGTCMHILVVFLHLFSKYLPLCCKTTHDVIISTVYYMPVISLLHDFNWTSTQFTSSQRAIVYLWRNCDYHRTLYYLILIILLKFVLGS